MCAELAFFESGRMAIGRVVLIRTYDEEKRRVVDVAMDNSSMSRHIHSRQNLCLS